MEQDIITPADWSDRPDDAVFIDQTTGKRHRRRIYVWVIENTVEGRVGKPMVLDRDGQRLVTAEVFAAQIGNCTFEAVRPWMAR